MIGVLYIFLEWDARKDSHIYCIDYVCLVLVIGGVDDVEGFARGPLSLKMQGLAFLLTTYMWIVKQVDFSICCGQKKDKKDGL